MTPHYSFLIGAKQNTLTVCCLLLKRAYSLDIWTNLPQVVCQKTEDMTNMKYLFCLDQHLKNIKIFNMMYLNTVVFIVL